MLLEPVMQIVSAWTSFQIEVSGIQTSTLSFTFLFLFSFTTSKENAFLVAIPALCAIIVQCSVTEEERELGPHLRREFAIALSSKSLAVSSHSMIVASSSK